MHYRLSRAAAALGVTVVVLAAPTVGAQQTSGVDVRDNEFVEADSTVTAGDTVEWSQSGANPHSVTADDGSFDSHPDCLPDCMGQGDAFSHTFEKPGEYRYHCKIHGGPGGQGMSGIIRVQAAAQQEPTTTTTTATATQPVDSPTEPATTEAPSERLPNTGIPGELAVVAALATTVGVVLWRSGRRMAS